MRGWLGARRLTPPACGRPRSTGTGGSRYRRHAWPRPSRGCGPRSTPPARRASRDLEAAALIALGRWATLVAGPEAAELRDAALAAARATGDRQLIADSLLIAAGACERDSDWAGAVATRDRGARRSTATLGDPYGAATALAELGWYDMVTASAEQAEEYLDEALELRRRLGDDRRLVEPLIDGAWLALVQGDSGTAQARFLDCLAMARQVDDRFIVGEALAGLSTVAGTEGRWTDCALLAGASAFVHEQIGAPPWESVVMLHERETSAAEAALGVAYGARFAAGRSAAGRRCRAVHDRCPGA